MSPEEKRNTKCAIIREAVSKINKENVTKAVDRLYWVRQSLQGLDSDRTGKSFESIPEAKKKRSSMKNLRLMVVLKKQKAMLEISIPIILINNL